jgi:peptide chain release factor subunit 1
VSVYYPYGKGLEMISLLEETKRSPSIEKIESAIEKRISQLRKTPSSFGKFTKTLCIFGWIKNGRIQLKEVGTSKKLPYVYMLSKRPFLKPFNDLLETQHNVVLVTIDQKSAKLQKFIGNDILEEASLRIDLQGRHKKGGQSQGRFLRARQTKIHVFYKKVANRVRKMGLNSELILIGGNGQAKTEFFDELDSEIAQKCRFAENLSFSTPLTEVYKKIIHHLFHHRKKHVKEIIDKYERLVKSKLTAKRNNVIFEALKLGAVDTLIVSANYHSEPKFKNIMKMLEIAKFTSSKIEFTSSPKLIQKLELDESVLAILRYAIK